MKRFLILIFLSIPAFAQSPPVPPPLISAVVPAVGPNSGGTIVVITGGHLGLPVGFACLLPCPARVTFGDRLASLVSESDTALVVVTPPHAAGSVDVGVVTGDGRNVTAANAFLYTDNSEAAYERILLPIYLEAPVAGINGSLWETQLWMRNNGENGVTLAPWVCPPGALCTPVFPLTRVLQPGETLHNLPAVEQSNPGRVLFATRDTAASLSAGLRLYEKSRSDTDAGTEIPVIRESQLLAGPSHLHAVPLNGRFRLMLRIYELFADASEFRVRVYEQAEGVSGATPISEFTLRATSPEAGTFRFHAAYAEYAGLTDLLRQPALLPPLVRVDIEPLNKASRYWAFVSVTNNETQRVTIITPQ